VRQESSAASSFAQERLEPGENFLSRRIKAHTPAHAEKHLCNSLGPCEIQDGPVGTPGDFVARLEPFSHMSAETYEA
jgi:hypothetical protein